MWYHIHIACLRAFTSGDGGDVGRVGCQTHDSSLIVNHWISLTRNHGFSTFANMTPVNILGRTQNNSQLCLQWPKNVILIQSIIFPNPNQDFSCRSFTRTQAQHCHNLTLYTVPKEMERMQHKGPLNISGLQKCPLTAFILPIGWGFLWDSFSHIVHFASCTAIFTQFVSNSFSLYSVIF